ncbi:MAG TPA: hypothetical protein VL400_01580 [Polyangiaceae bacterium]|jgi:hypothetical protein|nr:hypothetical protein [Polyangiaceae bacterium]
MGRRRADSLRLAVAVAACGAALTARSLAAHADPLPSSDYDIDVFQGPLLTPIRVTSLGGAYAGFGEGIAGLVSNAAAPAVREPFSPQHVELSLSGSLSIPLGLGENDDFDNSGTKDADYSSFIYVNGGAIVQVGAFGAGIEAELQTYTLTDAKDESSTVVLGRYHFLTGVSIAHGDLAIGGGVRAATLGFVTPSGGLAYGGFSPELGILVRPRSIPFRFGGTYRFPVNAAPLFQQPPTDAEGRLRLGDLVLPRSATLPWEVEIGTAVQFGPRSLNMGFDDPEDADDFVESQVARARASREDVRERALASVAPEERPALEEKLDVEEAAYRKVENDAAEAVERRTEKAAESAAETLPRPRLLLLFALLATGEVERGVSFESFIAQSTSAPATHVIGSSGASINFSPRFGVEVEAVPRMLVLRSGGYYEPSRFGRVGRQHGTAGLALKLVRTDLFGLLPELDWGVELGVDLAPRYQSLSASLAVFR